MVSHKQNIVTQKIGGYNQNEKNRKNTIQNNKSRQRLYTKTMSQTKHQHK